MPKDQSNEKDIKRIPTQKFFDEYCGIMSDKLFFRYLDAKSNGELFFLIEKTDLEILELEKRKRVERDYLINTTAKLNNEGIAFEKQGKIDEAIKVYEENLKLGYQASHAFDRLSNQYRKRKDSENEKRVLRRRYEVYDLTESDLQKELEKIDNKIRGIKPILILPKQAHPYKITGETLGSRFERLIPLLPEFNFYNNKPIDEDTNTYLIKNPNLVNDRIYKPQIWEIQRIFKKMINDADKFKSNNDLDSAATIYEKIIAEECYLSQPYNKLKQIYIKSGLHTESQRIIFTSINYFSALRDRQRTYVLDLARKYGKLEFALQRIKESGKIYYYGGAFELYNSYAIIDTWRKQLLK
jgi:hypothetical protein